MPWSAPRTCRVCGQRSHGTYCETHHAEREAVRQADKDKRYGKAHQRGYDADWKKVKRQVLDAQPWCARCGQRAQLVHHIVHVKQDAARRLDPGNLEPLCARCHQSTHAAPRRDVARGA